MSWVESAFSDPAFASFESRLGPRLVLAFDPVRVVWANSDAVALFGTEDLDELVRRFSANQRLRQGFETLARHLKPGGVPRLERLAVQQGFAFRPSTLLCQRLTGPGGAAGLAVAIMKERSASAIGSHELRPRQEPAISTLGPVPSEQPETVEGPELDSNRPGEQAAGAAARSVPRDLVNTERDRLRGLLRGGDVQRFLWRTDALGCLLQIDLALFDLLDATIRPEIKADFAGTVAAFSPAEAERLRGALASRKAWSGMTLVWPTCAGRLSVPVTLSGSPQFENPREFVGYRGFGVLNVASLAETAESAPPPFLPGSPLQRGTTGSLAGADGSADAGRDGDPDDGAAVVGPSQDGVDGSGSLSSSEHFAFREIARTLGAKLQDPGTHSDQPVAPEDEHEPAGRGVPEASDSSQVAGSEGASEAFLLPLLDAVQEAAAMLDDSGRVLALNRQGERWFGRDRRRISGESFALLLDPGHRASAASLLAELGADPDLHAQGLRDVVARTPDGDTLSLLLTLTRVGPGRFAAVWRDVSALKRLQRDLARAETQLERSGGQHAEFLAKMSHEIRTPLNAILGFTEVIMEERFGPIGNPRYKDYLQDIHASGSRVMALVDDLLDLSRIEAGRHELQLAPVEINKVIGECVAQMQPQAHRERVIVRTSFGAHLPPVTADANSVRQIVSNLLSNAVKFNEPGGQVIVSTAMGEGGSVAARIRDTGVGMSDADITAALEPFRQFSGSKSGGTGLGLPLSKALAEANGASLSIRSRPGEGTLVEVAFTPAEARMVRVPA